METHAPELGLGLIALALAATVVAGAGFLILTDFVAEARRDSMLRNFRRLREGDR